MTIAPTEPDDQLPVEAMKRANALEALSDGSMARAELMDALDVSRTTVHRVVRGLEDLELLIDDGGKLELTALGRTVAQEVMTYHNRLRTARRLQPFLDTNPDETVEIDIALFEDAVVTEMKPSNPYAPLARFMELLRQSETVYGFDTTMIAPVYVDEIREEILAGMQTDIIYLPVVVEDMIAAYPDEIKEAIQSGQLTLSAYENLPFGLVIFEERIGLGGYDDETGLLRVFVDTDEPEARNWALDLYNQYRELAEPVELPLAVSD